MSTLLNADFSEDTILDYLGLTRTYEPRPSSDPIAFLQVHLQQLPLNLLLRFSVITTPKQRTVIPAIRNRRFKHTLLSPHEFSFEVAKNKWPELWDGHQLPGQEKGKEEKDWVEKEFLGGQKGYVGKLGVLLGDYEEEREAERARLALRRKERTRPGDRLEEIMDQDKEVSDEGEAKDEFLHRIREHFIYGLLESADYDCTDWNEALDNGDRDAEEKWFDEEDDESVV